MTYFGDSVDKAIRIVLERLNLRNKPFFAKVLREYSQVLEGLVLSRFRTKLRLHCSVCGSTVEFRTDKPMVCPVCGEGLHWRCHNCGYVFDPSQAELCIRCRWFICPRCRACGCQHPIKREEAKQPIKLWEMM